MKISFRTFKNSSIPLYKLKMRVGLVFNCRRDFLILLDISLHSFLSYLQEKDEDSIVKQSLKISVDLRHDGQNSFYSSLKKMTDYYNNLPGFNCNLLHECKIKFNVNLMQKKYIWK